ncbi:hypothetical protein C1646_752284 [Rhizophagus diaphanus]|nr:hypothetical protein C1646_752284 [Rhizophagus diaphanus] [Rhizophagus sp. MUCL 43196]
MDKIWFSLYKKYKKETGHKPCEQCQEKGPITFEVRPNPELIINRGAHHALFAMENIGIMDYMAHDTAKWKSVPL